MPTLRIASLLFSAYPAGNRTKNWPVFLALLLVCGLACPGFAAKDQLQLVAPWEIKNADPANSGFVFSRLQITETLVEVDKQGKLVPGLATSWSMDTDGLQYHFQLRPDVVFHDGTPLTAEAAAQALQFALSKPGLLQKAPIREITADGNEIVISLREPYAILDAVLTHYSCAILAPSAYAEDGSVHSLIATGPFQVTSLEPPQKIVVQAFRQYWQGAPAIKHVQYLAVSRNETRTLMAESGDAAITYTLDPISLKRLQHNQELNTFTIPLPRTIVLKVNCALPFLRKPAYRRALSDNLDRQGLALAIMKDAQTAAPQLFPAGMGAWHREAYDQHPSQHADYKQLLRQDGWQEDKDGYLVKEGKRAELTLVTYSDRPELPVAATALQDQFKKNGIAVQVNVTNSSVIPQYHQDNTLELGLIARNYGLIVNPLATIAMDYGPKGGDWGAMNWAHPAMQQALAALMTSTDADIRNKEILAITTILHEEMPTIPVAYYQHSAVVSKKLAGFSLDPIERSYRLTDLHWREQ